MQEEQFVIVGRRPQETAGNTKKTYRYPKRPFAAMCILGIIVLGCLGSSFFIPKDPAYMDLQNCSVPPCRAFWFGTDTMGRDIFSMIWYGGRISLLIGFIAASIALAAAVLFGSVSGLAPRRLDAALMRMTEIVLSVPQLLLVILLQAVFGGTGVFGIAFVIGITSWTGMAKVVRTEVRQIRTSGYVIASKCMGGGFFHILRQHLAPNFMSSILFMAVMNIRSAIAAESTLSFMGLGLPLEIVSWGSMLSLSQRALLGGEWWMILIPGGFLALTLLCVTDIGNSLRRNADRRQSQL